MCGNTEAAEGGRSVSPEERMHRVGHRLLAAMSLATVILAAGFSGETKPGEMLGGGVMTSCTHKAIITW